MLEEQRRGLTYQAGHREPCFGEMDQVSKRGTNSMRAETKEPRQEHPSSEICPKSVWKKAISKGGTPRNQTVRKEIPEVVHEVSQRDLHGSIV